MPLFEFLAVPLTCIFNTRAYAGAPQGNDIKIMYFRGVIINKPGKMQGSQTRSAISQEANSIQYKGNNSGLRPSAISTRFKPVISYIQKNLQEEISIETLSRAAFMSEPHFYRSFKNSLALRRSNTSMANASGLL